MKRVVMFAALALSVVPSVLSAPSTAIDRPILGLFLNTTSFRVEVIMSHERGGAKMSMGPHTIDRTAIWKGTATVKTNSGKRLFTAALLAPETFKNLDKKTNTIYYKITATDMFSVSPHEGRRWDR